MTTADLIDAVMDYPCLIELTASDSPQQGFDAVREGLAAIDALLARPDAPSALVDRYRALDFAKSGEDEFPVIELEFFELLLAQPEVLDRLDEQGRAALAQAIEDKRLPEASASGADSGFLYAAELAEGRALAIDDSAFAERVKTDANLASFLADGNPMADSVEDWQETLDAIQSGVIEQYGVIVDGP